MGQAARASLLLTEAADRIQIGGESVPFSIRINPRARRLFVKVDPIKRQVILVVPRKRDVTRALDFAASQKTWIADRLAEAPKGTPFAPGAIIPVRGRPLTITPAPDLLKRTIQPDESTGRLLIGRSGPDLDSRVLHWLKSLARWDINERVRIHTDRLGVRPLRVTVRDTRTRWGSCSSAGALSFSWRLIMAPPDILDYVAAHEVAHLVHHDHSPAFWAVVRDLHDDPGGATAWLKRDGATLHRYGTV